MAKFSLMEPIDKAIFQKIEDLQANRDAQKFLDSYSNLDEKTQEIVKALMALALFLIPLGTIAVFYGLNSSLKSELEAKRELLSVSQTIISEQAGIQGDQRRFLGSTYVGNMNDMQNLVANAIRLTGIEPSKVSVSNFDSIEQDGFITQASIDMKFTGLSNTEMFGLISSLSERQKVKFDEVSIKKNESTNLLEGIATLLYISKDNPAGV